MPRHAILIVEDNATLRRLLEYRLSKHYDVRAAVNGEEALRMVDERAPDLIISDIMMPKMDGYALLNVLRRDETTRMIPFIFLTAKSDDVSRHKGLGQGSDDYITKPFDIDFLLTRIQKIFERNEVYQNQLNARISRDFSQKLMPKSMPQVPGYRALLYSQPREAGGGDLFDWVELRPGVFLLILADVMGKGLQAKFYAFSFLSYIRSTVHAMSEADDSPAALLTAVNRMLVKDEVLDDTFASMLLIRWEAETGTITYANAGHCRPILATPSGASIIEHSEMILGLDANETFSDRSFQLPPDSAIMAYTDGLTEQPLRSGEPFGEQALLAAIDEVASAEQPIHALLQRMLRASSEDHFIDDILVFWLQRLAVSNPTSESVDVGAGEPASVY